jgi:hypothetical protein
LTRFDPLWPPTPGAVFALANLGDVTAEPVQTRLGWSVLKLTGERPENKRTLPEVEKKIRERLWPQKREQAVDTLAAELREKYKPEIHAELLDDIKIDIAPPGAGLRPGFPTASPPPLSPAASSPGPAGQTKVTVHPGQAARARRQPRRRRDVWSSRSSHARFKNCSPTMTRR